MFPGGIADKAGNRYEAKWAVLRLLEVILGRADAIRYEGLDKTAHGFEFELHRNGIVEWYQAKRRGTGNWTPRRLETKGVLTSFGERLSAAPSNQYMFVSSDPAKEMSSLTEQAELADDFGQFNDALPGGLRATFVGLQTQWKVTLQYSLGGGDFFDHAGEQRAADVDHGPGRVTARRSAFSLSTLSRPAPACRVRRWAR